MENDNEKLLIALGHGNAASGLSANAALSMFPLTRLSGCLVLYKA